MKDWVKLKSTHIGRAKLVAVEIEFAIVSGRNEIDKKLQPLVEKAVASIG